MKTKLTTIALLLALNRLLLAQTADDYVTQGRAFLSATNMVAANNSFSNAVALSPGHQTANVFYAATRLLALPSQPAGSNFLNRIGLPAAGRNIYNWTAELPADTNGVPFAPAGVNASEFTAMVRTNVLPALIAAEANLAKVTDTNFTLALTGSETRSVGVTLDYGDTLMLRAMLQAAEYSAYTTCSWNLDAQLAAIRSLYTNHQLSIERILMDCPNLLTFSTTNDLNAAKLAFQNGVDRYMEASQFIRNRPTNVTRLFNYDAAKATDEEKFRFTLTDLTNSFTTAVTLAVDTNYTVFLGSQFSGTHTLRSFLPLIRGNGFELGTLPDPTFGGLVYGLTRQELDAALAKELLPIPTIPPVFSALGGQFQFPINVAKDRGYVVQVSSNLLDWTNYAVFIATNGSYAFADTNAAAFPRRFYRVVDDTGNMPPPANDAFTNRILLAGSNVTSASTTIGATHEAGEPFAASIKSVWWSWQAPKTGLVTITATGIDYSYLGIGVYTGSVVSSLSYVASSAYGVPPYNTCSVSFTATSGTTYAIVVASNGYDGPVSVSIIQP